MARRFFLLIILMLPLVGCGSKGKSYMIGVDPNWFPVNLMGKEANVFAFSNELLYEISRFEGVNFNRINRSWDNLTMGLEEERYDGILSSIHPYVFKLQKYSFSDSYLNTGPVLVVRVDADIDITGTMRGKEVAVNSKEDEILLIRHFPEVMIRYYTMIPNAIDQLLNDYIDGVLVGYVPVTAFVHDIYNEKIKVATPPLNDAGFRLITMHDAHPELIEVFNRGLEKVRDEGIYEKLLKKWDLD